MGYNAIRYICGIRKMIFRGNSIQLTPFQVSKFVRPFHEDGRTFIRSAARQLLETNATVKISPKSSRSSRHTANSSPMPSTSPPKILHEPRTFSHYVMNLPASALTFLDAFIGLYRGHEDLFFPHTTSKLPMIHVHCFSTKSEDNVEEKRKIYKEISERLQFEISPDDPEVDIWDVRDVAPQKRMFCASFRLPSEVAF